MPGRPLNRVVPNRSLPAVMSNGAPVCATTNGLMRTAHFKLIEPPTVKRWCTSVDAGPYSPAKL